MPFDRLSWLHGWLAGFLVTLAIAVLPSAARAVPSTPIEGTSFFVAPAGVGVSADRSRPGNVNDTVRRICDGTAAQIAGGDAIIFLDGTYLTSTLNLPLPADARQSGRHGNAIAMLGRNCGGPLYIKLLADNAGGAILRNDVTANDTSGGFDIRASSYIWIEGFHVIGINNPSVPWEAGIKFSVGSHHVVALNNRIQGTGGGGVGAIGATHLRIEGNEIVNAANMHPYCASAISLYRLENAVGAVDDESGYSNYIVGNRVFGTRSRVGCDADTNPANGVRSSDGNCVIFDLNNETGYRNRTLVANNLCVDNGGGGVHVFKSSGVDVINNTLYGNGVVHRIGEMSVTCSSAGVPVQDVRFINNLVWATSTAPAVATNFNSGCVMSGIVHAHNVFVGNAPLVNDFSGVPYLQTTTDVGQVRTSVTGNLVGVTPAEIGFARAVQDPAAADFRIAVEGSPALESGLTNDCDLRSGPACRGKVLPDAYARDIDGRPRSSGIIDVGAYERIREPALPEPIPLPEKTVTVWARSTLVSGTGAMAEVYVNGRLIGFLQAISETRDFVFPTGSDEAIRSIDVVFVNDRAIDGEDRNLTVEAVADGSSTISASDSRVTIDVGTGPAAFDGLDVRPGQATIWWNGALRFQFGPQP